MKLAIKTVLSLLMIFSLAAALLPDAAQASGGAATVSLTPSKSLTVGDALAVSVFEDSGTDPVNLAHVVLNYPTGLLQYVSVTSSSDFDVNAPGDGASGGQVFFDRGACEPPGPGQPCASVTGRKLIATVTFKALAAGSAAVTFNSGTYVLRSDTNKAEVLTFQNSTYTIAAPPAPAPAPTPPPSGGGGGGGSPSKTPTPAKTTPKPSGSTTPASPGSSTPAAALTISGIQVLNLSAASATIHWKTSVPASSEVDFGNNTSYGLSNVSTALTADHSLALSPAKLRANEKYHFIVKSTDASGNTAVSADMTFVTQSPAVAPGKNTSAVWKALGAVVILGALGAVGLLAMQKMRGGLPPGSSGGSSYTPPPSAPASPAAPPETVIKPTKPAGPSV